MKALKFKTNINCGSCVATVTPFLNQETGIAEWQVETNNPQKILTVKTDNLSAADIIKIVQETGYKAETLSFSA